MRVRTTASEAIPTGASTVTLFDSFVAFAGIPVDVHEISRHLVTMTNSQALTLRLLKSQDGVTYDIVQSTAVPIPGAPLTVSGPIDFAVDGLRHYRVQLINGGVDQDATWRIDQEIVEIQRAKQS